MPRKGPSLSRLYNPNPATAYKGSIYNMQHLKSAISITTLGGDVWWGCYGMWGSGSARCMAEQVGYRDKTDDGAQVLGWQQKDSFAFISRTQV